MTGETNLTTLIRSMMPELQPGEYVFASVTNLSGISREDTICEFREAEGTTVVLERKRADALGISYDFVASWITLKVHSSLAAVGLTAVFATALAKSNISCNVMAGYYHDHIFVDAGDAQRAVDVLRGLSAEADPLRFL
ncbi:ACT domain-containing protein [Marinoscillum sp. 108]|uniref:ACT domain-containing protein n=1 Tax=Marinoscillum sp. 108 TaxID=2653151 RepID=UPI0012F2342B|nr:ACT domain-containing protein [Marinoscillum sp. 108]VXD16237.1 conserved hypothetical protein [Marinoscillum sp. 108]